MPLPPARLLSRTIYKEQLGQVICVDDEYGLLVNADAEEVAVWSRYDPDHDLYVEDRLVLAVGHLYLIRKREGIGENHYEDYKIARLVLVPPAENYPEPVTLWHDAAELGIGVRCLYLEEQGRVKIDEGEWEMIEKLRKTDSYVVWCDDFSEAGHFENTIYVAEENRLLWERTWHAYPGYCGSEKQIYLITLGISGTP